MIVLGSAIELAVAVGLYAYIQVAVTIRTVIIIVLAVAIGTDFELAVAIWTDICVLGGLGGKVEVTLAILLNEAERSVVVEMFDLGLLQVAYAVIEEWTGKLFSGSINIVVMVGLILNLIYNLLSSAMPHPCKLIRSKCFPNSFVDIYGSKLFAHDFLDVASRH